MTTFDPTPYLTQPEGQYFDRKSLWEGLEGHKRCRDRRTVRDQIAKYVAAFANADGGVLILGLEDDGSITGHGYSDKAIQTFLQTPQSRLTPPQLEGVVIEFEGHQLIVFDVPISSVSVQVIGDGFPLRYGDQVVQASETMIQQTKFVGLVESFEAQPSRLQLDDLDEQSIHQAKKGAGLAHHTPTEYLLHRRLAERKGRNLQLRQAAELLFCKGIPEHPNSGLRFFSVFGTERTFGTEHNVQEHSRIEGNLVTVLAEGFDFLEGKVRTPSQLRGDVFVPVPEYPEFVWKEMVLNAVAHRDYNIQGRTTEVWLFENRLEVESPGTLLEGIDFEQMRQGRRIHKSRNPKIVRVLVDLGYMRDQGEGIPRIYTEMAQVGRVLQYDQTDFTFRMVIPSLLDEESTQSEDKKAPVEVKRHQFDEEKAPVGEKRHQFLQQYSPTRQKVFLAILEHTADWITLSDLLERLQKSGNKRFLRDYITPMVQEDILERRGEANAANQAYRRMV